MGRSARSNRDEDNLSVPRLPSVAWQDGRPRECVEAVYEWAERLISEAIVWYLAEKKRKARWSRALRALAALLVTLGGAVPIAALAADEPTAGNWGFVLLALAAGCVAYDRYFGYSSSWLRYVHTAMDLRGQLSEFQLVWTKELAVIGDREVSADEVQRLLHLVLTAVQQANHTIQAETESWVSEFGARLLEFELGLRQSPPVPSLADRAFVIQRGERT